MSSSTGPYDPDSTLAYTECADVSWIESNPAVLNPEYEEVFNILWGQKYEV